MLCDIIPLLLSLTTVKTSFGSNPFLRMKVSWVWTNQSSSQHTNVTVTTHLFSLHRPPMINHQSLKGPSRYPPSKEARLTSLLPPSSSLVSHQDTHRNAVRLVIILPRAVSILFIGRHQILARLVFLFLFSFASHVRCSVALTNARPANIHPLVQPRGYRWTSLRKPANLQNCLTGEKPGVFSIIISCLTACIPVLFL